MTKSIWNERRKFAAAPVLVAIALALGLSRPAEATETWVRLPLEDSGVAQSLVESAVGVLDRLIASGIKTVDGIDLVRLRLAISKVKVDLIYEGPIPLTSGHRRTAYYSPAERRVTLRNFVFKFVEPRYADTLSLHETLGASGIDDVDYQLSLKMSLLSRPMSPAARDLISKSQISGGGVTSVGGGGDILAVLVKQELIQNLIEESSVDESFLSIVFNLSFEPSPNPLETELKFEAREGSLAQDKIMTVLVPRQRILYLGGPNRNLVVNEIAESLKSLFPVKDSVPQVTYRCNDYAKVKLPRDFKPEFTSLRYQMLRGWLGPAFSAGACEVTQ